MHRQGKSQKSGWLVVLIALAIGFALACGDDDAPASAEVTRTQGIEGEIVVFAASSLTDAMKELGKAFEAENPKTKVTFNFAASSALAIQINEGALADVFASADDANMKAVSDKGSTEGSRIFVQNSPVLVVAKDNKVVQSFADLARPGVKLVLAGPAVPIGKYAREVLAKASAASGGISADFSAKVLANLKSEEANVRAVHSKVQLGEADAGIVYVTDIGAASGDVKQIDIPAQYNVVAQYPIAALKTSKRIDAARAFVNYALSEKGQAILVKYGFQKAPLP